MIPHEAYASAYAALASKRADLERRARESGGPGLMRIHWRRAWRVARMGYVHRCVNYAELLATACLIARKGGDSLGKGGDA